MRKLHTFLQKVYAYLPILWEDYDWDYHYILKLLQFKLARTRKQLQKNNIVCDSELKVMLKSLSVTEKLLQRVMDDKYADWLDRSFKGKYKFDPLSDRANVIFQNIPELQKEWIDLYHTAGRMRQRDLDRAFKIMSKHLFTWWD